MKKTILTSAYVLLALGVANIEAQAADVTACVITKTDTNPFFVKIKEGAVAKSKELGINLKAYAGKIDGDTESQIAAVEACIADGAKGIPITASDTKGIVPVSNRRAMQVSLLLLSIPRWSPLMRLMPPLRQIISSPVSWLANGLPDVLEIRLKMPKLLF